MENVYEVKLEKLIEKMELVNYTPKIDVSEILIHQAEINRPALQLAGFFDHFAENRVQIIGRVEQVYLQQLEQDKIQMLDVYEQFLILRFHVLYSQEAYNLRKRCFILQKNITCLYWELHSELLNSWQRLSVG